jgi:predicted Zn finger-like uncharacterized protein
MIIVCLNCSARLQVDEEKATTRPFSVRCPKCNATVEEGSASPASQKGALTVGGSPATDHPRYEQPTPAPLFQPTGGAADETQPTEIEKLAQLLAGLTANAHDADLSSAFAPGKRKVLVCTSEAHREEIARLLADDGYQVFVAENTEQAVERMRGNQLSVVILEPQFDQAEQGAAFVLREVNVLRPAQRRRLFFVLLSPSLRTMDSHTAFLSNVNAIINFSEIPEIPRILEHALRDHNDLYKNFKAALKVATL